MVKYYVTVRVGFYDFTREFDSQQVAVECFDSIATVTDAVVDNGYFSSPSNASVAEVEIKVVNIEPQIGNPNRR